MPKDFEQFKAESKNYTDYQKPKYTVDPNLFVNEASSKEILEKNRTIQMINVLGTAALSLITAPLTTAQISLQLSVLAHKNKYGDVTEMEKNQIMNIPKEVTAYDKRRYELIIKSGVTGANKPFRAPVYTSYREVFQALGNQGLLGFYKGNMLGLMHTWLGSYTRLQALHNLEYNNHHFYQNMGGFGKGLFVSFVCATVDMLIHPVQVMQSRFVLQNRLPNFSLYKSVFHFLKKHSKSPKTYFQGVATHIPKNIIFSISHFNFFKGNPKEGFLVSNLLAQIFSYPLTTVLRRLHCQDTLPGMLPVRYTGWWHATKLIFLEEGIRGLYRGFLAFSAVNTFMTMLIFNLTYYSDYVYDLKANEQYDLSCMTFSPDGKVFQVEYAGKAVENSETIVGVLCKDGVVLGTEKVVVSKMTVQGSNRRIFNIHDNLGMVIGGRIPDGKNIVNRARLESHQYKQNYGIDISGSTLMDRVGQYVHTHTLYNEYRPFGTAAIVASYDEFDKYSLYMVEPSGQYLGYYGVANGRGKNSVKGYLDKTDFKNMSCREALFHIAKVLHLSHREEFKEKTFELELSWLCDDSKQIHQMVPTDLKDEAEKRALESIEKEELGE